MTGLPGAFDRAQLSNCSLIALQRECLESGHLASTCFLAVALATLSVDSVCDLSLTVRPAAFNRLVLSSNLRRPIF